MKATVLSSPLMLSDRHPDFASAAPARPPINAWDEREGILKRQVKIFHAMAPTSAPNYWVTLLPPMLANVSPERFITFGPRSRRADHSPPWKFCAPAKLSNFVYWPTNVSLTGPIGPLRCLPIMTSAVPLSGLSGL